MLSSEVDTVCHPFFLEKHSCCLDNDFYSYSPDIWKDETEHFFFVLQESSCVVNTNFLAPGEVLQILHIPPCRISGLSEICAQRRAALYQKQADASLWWMCVSPWSLHVHGTSTYVFLWMFYKMRLSENARNRARVNFPSRLVAASVSFPGAWHRTTVTGIMNVTQLRISLYQNNMNIKIFELEISLAISTNCMKQAYQFQYLFY